MDPNVETTPSGPSSLEKFASPMADDLNFNPYYLGNSNNSGTLLVTQPLNGADNYHYNKYDFFQGSKPLKKVLKNLEKNYFKSPN